MPAVGRAGAESSHPGGLPDTCPEVLSGAPTGDLEMGTIPSAGSAVRGGDVITVTLRWNPETFGGPAVHKVLDCVTVSGDFAPDLSGQERDAPNDGRFERHFTVPAHVPGGARICDRGFVSGWGSGNSFERQKSNDTCFTVVAPGPSNNGSPSPPVAPSAAEGGGPAPDDTAPTGSAPMDSTSTGSAPTDSAPNGSGPNGSGPNGNGPGGAPDSTLPAAPRTPEAISTGPAPTAAAPAGAQPSPVDVLASPPAAPGSPEVHSATALPATGSTPTPLVLLAGMVLCAAGACLMTGVRRQRRTPPPARRGA